jgi:NAD+ diphosphatase
MADAPPLPRFDRAAHLRKDIDFLESQLRDRESLVVPMWRDMNLIAGNRAALLRLGDTRELLDLECELVWLGKLDSASCFAIDVSPLPDPLAHRALATAHGEFKDLRFVAAGLPADEVALLAFARGILYWHGRQRHCGVCGERTAARDGGHVRACRNQDCNTQHFPRTDPAIIVLVRDADRCLLGRQRHWPKGMYSTLAGFVEPGETIEQAVVREVFEESGIVVDDMRYVRSQPWPYPASLMIGFQARAASTEIFIGDDELEDARWFSRADLQANLQKAGQGDFFVPSAAFSLAGQLIRGFLDDESI